MSSNFMSTGSAPKRIVGSVASLAVAGATLGLATGTADADSDRPDHPKVTSTVALRPGDHVPATKMSTKSLAAQSCYLPGAADDAVLRTLKSTADKRHVSSTVRLAVFETAWVESHANSIPCGDLDSAGVFQQRPSQDWGSSSEVQDPSYAVNKFLDGNGGGGAIAAAKVHPDWSAGKISQAVQGSKYPSRYDAAATKAKSLMTRASDLHSGKVTGGHYSWPEVQNGEHNHRVETIQLLLKSHGYGLAADGIWGQNTEKAVKSFQSKSGLTSDGIVGKNTWGKLIFKLSAGNKSNATKALQSELRVHGYDLKETGSYDAATAKAVKALRAGHKMPSGTSTDSAVWNTLVGIGR